MKSSLGRATLAAAKFEVVDPAAPVDLSLPEHKRYESLLAKYGKQINDLSPLDYRFFERGDYEGKLAVLSLLERISQHKYFGSSQPKIDLEFLLNLLKVFRMEEIRTQMNKAVLWLNADPKRKKKNYRTFLVGWLSRAQQKSEVHYHVHDRGDA